MKRKKNFLSSRTPSGLKKTNRNEILRKKLLKIHLSLPPALINGNLSPSLIYPSSSANEKIIKSLNYFIYLQKLFFSALSLINNNVFFANPALYRSTQFELFLLDKTSRLGVG